MAGKVGVTLFETTVLLDVVHVVSANNECSLHLGGDDNTSEHASTDGDISSEGALLVNISSLDGLGRCLDSQTDLFYVTHGLLAFISNGALAGDENGILLLVRLFVLYSGEQWVAVITTTERKYESTDGAKANLVVLDLFVINLRLEVTTNSTYDLSQCILLRFSAS